MRAARAAAVAAVLAFATPALAAPAMWEVSDADSKITIFGSAHVLPPRTDWRTPAFDDAVRNADRVYLEAEVGLFTQIFLLFQVVASGLNLTGENWADKLSPEDAAIVETALEARGSSLEAMQQFRPWFVNLFLQTAGTSGTELNMAAGVEANVYRQVGRKKSAYLETAAQQVALLSNLPEELQLRIMVETVSETDVAPADIDDLAEVWLSGEEERLFAFIEGDRQLGYPEVLEVILYRRNENWIPVLEKQLADNEQNLVIVGAAHLIGERGVVELLRARGYSVRRIQ